MNIPTIEKRNAAAVTERVATEGGRTVPEAHAPGVTWIPVQFTRGMQIPWNWDDLLQDATAAEENLNLVTAGLVLSNDVEFTARRGEGVLRQLGFDEIMSEYYLLSTRTRNEVSDPARTFGHKKLEKGGKEYHVFCAVIKGTTTVPDAITDAKSVLDGFYEGGRSCAASLKEYIDRFEGADKDNTILFITGHSLGASTANVLGRLSRAFANDNANFVYTFASPNYETEGEWNDGKSYPNFHYYTNADDIVPDVPLRLPPHHFSKIGKEHLFNYDAMEKNQKERFTRAYRYFRGGTYEEDKDLLGLNLKETESLGYRALKNHLCHTYMSFVLSELCDEEIDRYLCE
ncbi:MAG: hypothetical protein IJH91_03440 [Mogibacterium sp.]|nr:hypothetical protein [Mogibacterium sp.]